MGIEPRGAAVRRLRSFASSSPDAQLRRYLLPLIAGTSMSGEFARGALEIGSPGSTFVPSPSAHAPTADPQTTRSASDWPVPVAARWGGERTAPLSRLADVDQEIEPFADDPAPVARALLSDDRVALELLAAAGAQQRALALVLEAHLLGATTLPEPVLRTVRDASARLARLFAVAPSDAGPTTLAV